jgi:hypothetical protein
MKSKREENLEFYRLYDLIRGQLPQRQYAAFKETRQRYNKTKKAKQIIGKYNKKWRLENPEKIKAHSDVQDAIIAGTLKIEPCIHCGKKAHAHHDDYSKPLDVMWLCPQHHADRHKELRTHV